MIDQLLTTKLYAPPIRPGLVRRPRLLQKMDLGLQAGSQLTLITAPAGYGKTTLALEWMESLERPWSWLSLGREDNHPVHFLTYLAAAVEQVDGQRTPLLPPDQAAPDGPDDAAWVQARLTALVNQVAQIARPFVLVLDDYHTIADLSVHQALGFLIEHQPPQMHLVITSRQDPLLPLSKLRSRGQITEVRLGELRFNREEAERFLNGTMRLGLVPEQVAALEARTEGWIAGLQLAAISLAELPAWSDASIQSKQRSRYIRLFTGDDRHVVDYLMDEVLSHQPEEIQRFLLYTSVLKRLCGPLCDALFESRESRVESRPEGTESRESRIESRRTVPGLGDGSRFSTLHSRSTLEYLDRSNLFLIPLDNRRQWYRYHHLFSDLLSSRLQASAPDLVATLHCRASQWYETAGMSAEAVDHALLAEDFDRALRLIEHTARTSIWSSGDLPVLLNWSRRLPEDVLVTRPRLSLYYARALFFTGQVSAAENYLESAEQALRSRAGSEAASEELWGVLYTNQATVRAMCGDSKRALDLARLAEPRIPATDSSTHARIAHAVGMAHFLGGDVQEAETAFTRAARLAQQVNNRNLGLDAVSCLALTLILAGKLGQAGRICQDGLAADPANQNAPAASAVYLAMARLHYEHNELPEAVALLDRSLELGRKAGWFHVLWQAYTVQAQVRQAAGDPAGALEALKQAEQVAQRYPIPRVARMVSAFRARLDVAEGNLNSAARWAEGYRRQPSAEALRDFEELTLAYVLLAQGQAAEARLRLDRVIEQAKSASRHQIVIHALILRSLSLEALGDRESALESLTGAIELAEPEGFIRAFLNEGQEMAHLLAALRQTRASGQVIAYSSTLLAAFEDQGIKASSVPAPRLDQTALVEPLSERELEVLQYIADGLSNPEIAAHLYLSVNTLKAHTTNIYQKLDVHNRVQAVTRAKELGLIK